MDAEAPTSKGTVLIRYVVVLGLGYVLGTKAGRRRYDGSILARLEVIRLCKSAGFALEEIQLLFADDAPGRPASRALAEAEARRQAAEASARPIPKESGGPKGPEPTRYGDWENKGIASDF